MTANQMRHQLSLITDGTVFRERITNDREASEILTLAQLYFLKRRFDPLKNRTGRGFAEAIRQDEVGAALSAASVYKAENHDFMKGTEFNGAYRSPDLDAQPGSTQEFGCFVPIPDEALYMVNVSCMTKKGTRIIPNVPTRMVDPMLYDDLVYDAFKGPGHDLIWLMYANSYTTANNPDPDGDGNTAEGESIFDYSTKFGDTRVDATANPTDITGFKGVSIEDDVTTVHIKTHKALHLIPGKGYDMYRTTLHYVKAPNDIVVNVRDPLEQKHSELSPAFHDEIVEIARLILIGSIVPAEASYQLADKEVKEDE